MPKIQKETRNIGKNLSSAKVKENLSKIKWKKDHRGIHYNKKTGIVTTT